MALTDGEVVGVVGGGDLDAARAKSRIDVLIGHDRNRAAHQGQGDRAAHQIGVAGIRGVHRHRRVAEHGFGAGGGHHQVIDGVLAGGRGRGRSVRRQRDERIAQMPEGAVHLLHLHLQIAHRRARSGAPIDQIFAAIDQALLMQAHKRFHHRLVQARIEGEALPLPVHRIAEAPQLSHDRAAAFRLPGPGALKKSIAAQVVLAGAFGLELLLEDRLHGDRGVVGTRQTQHVLAPQALEAHHRVDQGRVEGMAHVQAAGHVRRRDDDGEGFPLRRRIRMESPRLLPGLLPAGLGASRVVGLGQGVAQGCGAPRRGRFRGFVSRHGIGHGDRHGQSKPWSQSGPARPRRRLKRQQSGGPALRGQNHRPADHDGAGCWFYGCLAKP